MKGLRFFSLSATGLLLTGFVIVWGCGDRKQHDSQQLRPQIMFYHYFSGDLSGGIDGMVNVVNKRQQECEVKARALDHEAFKTMIPSMLKKGDPPELFSYWAGAMVQGLVDNHQLRSVDEEWQAQGLDKCFPKSVIDAACTYNGRKYLIPLNQHLTVVFFNRRIFEENNLRPPRTWQEFRAVCKKLKAKGICPIAMGAKERWPAQFWFDYLLLRTAGPAFRARLMAGKEPYTAPEVIKACRLFTELVEDGYFNPDVRTLDWAQATELVCQKKAAMTLMGTWALQVLGRKSYGLQAGEDYGYFLFPTIDERFPQVAVGPIDGLVVSGESERPKTAAATAPFFAGRLPQQKMSMGSGGVAPSILVPEDFYPPFQRSLLADIKNSPGWAFNYDLATPKPVAQLGLDAFIELLAFPDQYQTILKDLEAESHKYFAGRSGQKKDD